MSRRKISTTVYLTPEQVRGLEDLHERTRVPTAVYIREGVDLLLAFYAGAGDIGGQALIGYRETVLARLRGGQ